MQTALPRTWGPPRAAAQGESSRLHGAHSATIAELCPLFAPGATLATHAPPFSYPRPPRSPPAPAGPKSPPPFRHPPAVAVTAASRAGGQRDGIQWARNSLARQKTPKFDESGAPTYPALHRPPAPLPPGCRAPDAAAKSERDGGDLRRWAQGGGGKADVRRGAVGEPAPGGEVAHGEAQCRAGRGGGGWRQGGGGLGGRGGGRSRRGDGQGESRPGAPGGSSPPHTPCRRTARPRSQRGARSPAPSTRPRRPRPAPCRRAGCPTGGRWYG